MLVLEVFFHCPQNYLPCKAMFCTYRRQKAFKLIKLVGDDYVINLLFLSRLDACNANWWWWSVVVGDAGRFFSPIK